MRALTQAEAEILVRHTHDGYELPPVRDRAHLDLARRGYLRLSHDGTYLYTETTPKGLLALRCHAALLSTGAPR